MVSTDRAVRRRGGQVRADREAVGDLAGHGPENGTTRRTSSPAYGTNTYGHGRYPKATASPKRSYGSTRLRVTWGPNGRHGWP